MTDEQPDLDLPPLPVLTGRPWVRRVGAAAGVALLVTAVAVVWTQRDLLADAAASLRSASPLVMAVLLVAVVANVVLTGGMFSLLMSRYGRVGVVEMQAVIAATALVNYLPLRPGLFGRLTYHKLANGIPVHRSVRAIFQALGLSVAVALYLAAILAVAGDATRVVWGAVAAPVPVLAVAGLVAPVRIWAWAGLLRYLDVLVWAARYHAAFHLLGLAVPAHVSLAFACIGVIATMVPLVSNGLGLREWAIGLAMPLLAGRELELGLAAELVNRAAEVMVFAALGLAGLAWLVRARKRRSGSPAPRP